MSTPAAASSDSATSRELVFQEDGSHKFWKIVLNGSSHTVNYGRVGTSGQEQTKDFADDAAAKKSFDKLVAEKLKKGYVDQSSGGTSAAGAAAPVASSATSTATAKKPSAAKKPAAKKSNAAPSSDAADASETGDRGQSPAVAASAKGASAGSFTTFREPFFDLAPEDRMLATFLPRTPLQLPTAKPFNRDAAIKSLGDQKRERWQFYNRLNAIKMPVAMTREEAYYWLMLFNVHYDYNRPTSDFIKRITNQKVDGTLDATEALPLMRAAQRKFPEHMPPLLRQLLPISDVVRILIQLEHSSSRGYQNGLYLNEALQSFRRRVVPYLTAEEIAEAQSVVRKNWDPTKTPANLSEPIPHEYYFAAMLGMHDEVLQVVKTWPNDVYGGLSARSYYKEQEPAGVLLGLGSAELIEQHWRRVKAPVVARDDALGLLACTGCAMLDLIVEGVTRAENKERSEYLLKPLTLAHAPEAAGPLLQCQLESKTPAIARAWFDDNVDFAIAGLTPIAARTGKLAEAALDFLRGAMKRGHSELVKSAVAASSDAAVVAKLTRDLLDFQEKEYKALDDASTPDWLRDALAASPKSKARKLPSWASPAMLPPLTVGDAKLNDAQTAAVLDALASTPVGEKHPLLTALKQHLDRRTRDEFAWKLFQAWEQDGTPSKEKWAMGAVGHLGEDLCVLKLTPLIRNWPGESQHQRAVFGLECFRAIGSNVALMSLSGIAQKLKFKGLKSKAEQCVQEIAEEMGLTRAELEDRVVPDCGLDEHGRREFSFGQRAFSFALGPELKPMLRDADGKLKGDLPKPNAKDDAQKAADSVAEWKILKKQIRDVAQLQASRLEQAMVVGRRWKVADFEALLVKHPLMKHLTRTLVWGAFDVKGKRLATFRLTDEGDYADSQDEPASLANVEAVGILHPLDLTEAERSAWGEVLSDYEIVSPFPQLGRPVHTLTKEQAESDDFTLLKGMKIPSVSLVGTLERLGWERGPALDGGCFQEHTKFFPAANVRAIVEYDGVVAMGYIDPSELLTIEHAWLARGDEKYDGWSWHGTKKMKLGEASPVAISELLSDLHVLKSKAK